ncbi:Uncharacterised protein [Aggregatibacter actinomycetemcomitans]|uniref:DUF2513 domain-containing protein n=1 Tax=Aggregatibacter actinomycetemcomitans TaxID=714 RepID=UPI0001B9F16A|nr:DUF2513 domain-containing protein [Aggregatibacter actinomycetemcomitans]ACX82568.1 hypothetical protein D11S_1185 [Aggregatibacter actinomycetemcomitans D11S-1]KOE62448.1 hypothetical protein D17P2_0303875 [Aggregatibacter actinomycetemcomitans serotype c str. D17P-2]SSY84950.1 Uncharacterised protein [Aggregatibacter actinomycetemcomitans]
MKRNWDLIRKILIKLEEKADSTSWLQDNEIKGYDTQTIAYHYKLLTDAGLIKSVDMSSMNEISYAALSLTWQGHEFLDKIRNDSVWNKVKSTVQSKSLDLSFDVIKQAATALIGSMLP